MSFRTGVALVVLLAFSGAAHVAHAGAAEDVRARQNYILNCQGCHLADGSGFPDKIPNLKGFVGNFLQVPGGREFIVQVPGVANAPLTDEELADVMNWLLINFSAGQLPDDYQPYTAAEVTRLRQTALIDIAVTRADLIQKMESASGLVKKQ